MKEMQLTSTILSQQNTASNKVNCTHPENDPTVGKKHNITPQTDKSWKIAGIVSPLEPPEEASEEEDQTIFMFDRGDVDSMAQI